MSHTNETSENEAEKIRAERDALKAKNQELIREKQAAKAAAEQAALEAKAAKTAAAARNGDMEAVTAAHAKELAKLQKQIDERDSQLRTITVDNAIAQSLATSNIRPEFTEALSALFKSKSEFAAGEGTIAGEPITDYIASYLKSEQGAHYVRPADNNGGGATGSKGAQASAFARAPETPEELHNWMSFSSVNRDEAIALAQTWNRPDLSP